MNSPSPDLPPGWGERVTRARADTPPPHDSAALLRAVHRAAAETAGRSAGAAAASSGWGGAFRALAELGRGPLAAGCAAACLVAVVVGWQAWTEWEELAPWVEIVADAGLPLDGGAS